jgi:hypothetical protein
MQILEGYKLFTWYSRFPAHGRIIWWIGIPESGPDRSPAVASSSAAPSPPPPPVRVGGWEHAVSQTKTTC